MQDGAPDRPIQGAGVVIWSGTAKEPRFLLLRNSLHRSWGLAKGHLDAGENLFAAALREVHEECGFLLEEHDLLPDFADCSVYQPRPDLWKRVTYFLARAAVDADGLQRSAEHDQHLWLPPDEAIARLEHVQTRRTLRRAAVRLASLVVDSPC